jgi:transcriptional regulator with XRE-family HTH domain
VSQKPSDNTPRKHQAFADRLDAAMKRGGLTHSEVARRVWGTTKDRRGYDVAKNRDRIGHFLSGKSYPRPDNLLKLAEALGISLDDLAEPSALPRSAMTIPPPQPPAPPAERANGVQLTPVPGEPGKVRVRGTIDRVMDLTQVQEVVNLLMKQE